MSKAVIFASHPISFLNFRLKLMTQLKSLGYEVIALSPYDEHVQRVLSANGIEFIGTKIDRTGKNPFRDILSFLSMLFLLRRIKPSVVIH